MSWLPLNKVLVPIDFSGFSAGAIREALSLVASPEKLRVVNVVVPLDNMSPGLDQASLDDASRIAVAENRIDTFLADQGFDKLHSSVLVGEPGATIAEHATEIEADLIVMPSHGYHGLKRMVLGSVTERVLRYAGVPVLVVRRPDSE